MRITERELRRIIREEINGYTAQDILDAFVEAARSMGMEVGGRRRNPSAYAKGHSWLINHIEEDRGEFFVKIKHANTRDRDMRTVTETDYWSSPRDAENYLARQVSTFLPGY
jgi:hypothetical protein